MFQQKIGSGKQQIWIAAIDMAKLGSGDDPSYPAFRVPFMELSEDCHRPFWALDALSDCGTGGMGGTGGGPQCVNLAGDCTSGLCCSGLECTYIPNDDSFVCEVPLG